MTNRFVEYLQFLAGCRRRVAVIVNATCLTAPDRCPLSHVVSVDIEINDIAAVRAACQRMGWEFKEGQQTYKWWGKSVGDYPLPDGVSADDLGKCDHAIGLPGAAWEIGLMKRDGKFVPVWDYFSGGGLENILPENGMNGFLQAYAIEKAKVECRKQGRSVHETKREDGSVRLEVRV